MGSEYTSRRVKEQLRRLRAHHASGEICRAAQKAKGAHHVRPLVLLSTVNYGLSTQFNPGDDRLSHAVARAVPWALEGLTTVFGMGTGVTPPV